MASSSEKLLLHVSQPLRNFEHGLLLNTHLERVHVRNFGIFRAKKVSSNVRPWQCQVRRSQDPRLNGNSNRRLVRCGAYYLYQLYLAPLRDIHN